MTKHICPENTGAYTWTIMFFRLGLVIKRRNRYCNAGKIVVNKDNIFVYLSALGSFMLHMLYPKCNGISVILNDMMLVNILKPECVWTTHLSTLNTDKYIKGY